jgi:hypothetical protein
VVYDKEFDNLSKVLVVLLQEEVVDQTKGGQTKE